MFNKDLRPIDTTIFLNKLDALLEKLRMQYQDGGFDTQEDVIQEFVRNLNEFYEKSHTPFLTLNPVSAGTLPNYVAYNRSFGELRTDLDILFKELNTLETVVLKNFNYTVSERDKVNKLVKRIGSKVGDYVLYSQDPLRRLIYFKDSFNDTSKIDFGSSLLSKTQCEIDTIEGVVSLPINQSAKAATVISGVQINSNSGPFGSAGNYQQLGASPHDDIRDILDSNPDTWFEYERVQKISDASAIPLTLDLTLYFDSPQIINYIRINPNNFGQQTPVRIEQIDTSLDGKIWISIKDDIPIANYLQQDEENVFTLASSTSKYAGQGLYTFTPRKVKFIHLVFRQTVPYEIETPAGVQMRYAIGIRDIEVQGVQYESEGDVISTRFESPLEIQKVSIHANENPTEISELADIKHQISVDDGATWYDVQPQDRSGTTIPEVLNFNTSDNDSINTANPVYSLRHRMLLSRNADNFKKGSSTMSSIVKGAMDVLSMPYTSPAILNLSRSPVAESIRVMNPLWGSRALGGTKIIDTDNNGQETRSPVIKIIGRSTGQPDQQFKNVISQEINSGKVLIWKDVKTDIDYNEVVIWIDNDSSWERVDTFSAGDTREYKLTSDGTLMFGNYNSGTQSGNGRIPTAGASIGFTLKEERLHFSASKPYVCDLAFSTDGDKSNVKIYRYGLLTLAKPFNLRPGAKVIRLPHKLIEVGDNTPVFTEGGSPTVFITRVISLDQVDGTGDYYIDSDNGIIYSYDGIPATASGWTVTYYYTPRYELAENEWDFVIDSKKVYNRINVNDTQALNGTASLTSSVRMLQLVDDNSVPFKSISAGSIRFALDQPFTSGNAPHEVAFIDGTTEFLAFDTEIDTDGYYSVDYKNGILYVAPGDSIASTAGNTISFVYTNMIICYNIAKFLTQSSFAIDSAQKMVTISDREVLKLWNKQDIGVTKENLIKVIYDYVSMTRESIEELEPYFTPVIRDYVLKILPKG